MDEELAGLARKYRTIAEVRRQKLRTGAHTPRETMRALAAEFPGALRELDVLPIDELDRRAAALEAAAAGRPAEPWMRWMARHHALLRAALAIRAGRPAGEHGLDAAFAAACRSPPGGRIAAAVLDRLSSETGAPQDELRAALYPPRPTRAEVDDERARNRGGPGNGGEPGGSA